MQPGVAQVLEFEFQSTHPAKDATAPLPHALSNSQFQSTHPAKDATEFFQLNTHQDVVSIHASREGCDIDQF